MSDLELALQDGQPKRDELWDALMEACDIDSGQITAAARGAYNRAVSQLRRVRANPSDVGARAALYRVRFPHSPLTPSALCRHWPELKPPTPPEPVIFGDSGRIWLGPGTGWSTG